MGLPRAVPYIYIFMYIYTLLAILQTLSAMSCLLFVSYVARFWPLRCCVDIPRELDFLADCLVMTVQGCMHAQQQIEINEVKKGGYQGWEPETLKSVSKLE